MADYQPLNYTGAPDLLRSVQTGFNINRNLQERDLAQNKYQANLEQLAKENKRIEADRARADKEYEYDQGVREVNVNKKLGDIDGMNSGFKRSMKAVGMEIPDDMPISQDVYDEWIKVTSMKDPQDQDIAVEKFGKKIGESVGAYGRRLKAFGADVSGYDAGQKAEGVIAGEERKLAGQKDLETFKTDQQIRQDAEKIKAETAAKKELGPTGKAQTLTIGNKAYERNKDGKWDLVITGPVTGKAGKSVDPVMRELNLMDKISKQAKRDADREFLKYGKLPQREQWSTYKQKWEINPAYAEYPFDEYREFENNRIEELRTKAGISDTVMNTLREVNPVSETLIDPRPSNTPAAPDLPEGYTLGEVETTGKNKGLTRVYDQSGALQGHYK